MCIPSSLLCCSALASSAPPAWGREAGPGKTSADLPDGAEVAEGVSSCAGSLRDAVSASAVAHLPQIMRLN